MANSPTALDFTITLSAWLATAVGDGTWADVISELKLDQSGSEVAATAIKNAAGQLWANVQDDMFAHNLQFHSKGTKIWRRATEVARNALGSDDALAVGDICLVDVTRSVYICTAVSGATSSTWEAPLRRENSIVMSLDADQLKLGDGVTGWETATEVLISGFSAGRTFRGVEATGVLGEERTLWNLSNYFMYLSHQDGAADVDNQLYLPASVATLAVPEGGSVTLRYLGFWYVKNAGF